MSAPAHHGLNPITHIFVRGKLYGKPAKNDRKKSVTNLQIMMKCYNYHVVKGVRASSYAKPPRGEQPGEVNAR